MTTSSFTLSIGQRQVSLPKPCVMGVINCTPDSFYQALPSTSLAIEKAQEMVAAGVSIIDIGGVATNPNIDMRSGIPDIQMECDRVISVIEAVAKSCDVLISVDTSQPVVMKAAVDAGAHIINDQRALREPGALEAVAKLEVPVCLMHHFDPPRVPDSCAMPELLSQIKFDLQQDVTCCLDAGITADRIIIDPGFGGGNFGKSPMENFYLLSQLSDFCDFNLPILAGLSRKSMFGILDLSIAERLHASVSAATVAALKGAAIIRAHDVKETVDAMGVVKSLMLTEGL